MKKLLLVMFIILAFGSLPGNILRTVDMVNGGPFFGFGSYWLCMGACTGVGGVISAIMTAGVGTGAGVIYGAAACSSVCSATSTAIFCLPATP